LESAAEVDGDTLTMKEAKEASRNLVLTAVLMTGVTVGTGGALLGDSSAHVQRLSCSDSSPEHKLTPSEVRELTRSASTPDDHMKLAAHFTEEAAEEEEAARRDDRMAASFDFADAESHLRYLATVARKAARHANKMAEEQKKLADAMRNGNPGGAYRSR
jgi:hypothetical protein